MPAVRRITSAHPDRCSPRCSLLGVHEARTSTKKEEPRNSRPPKVSLISRVTVPVRSWSPAPATCKQGPSPHALREQGISYHVRVDLGAQLAHDTERAVPTNLPHRIMQDHHPTSRQGLSRVILVCRPHRECRREGRETSRWGNLLEEYVRQVVRLSQGQQSPHKLLGHRVFIHNSNRTGVITASGPDAPPIIISISSRYACRENRCVDWGCEVSGPAGCAR